MPFQLQEHAEVQKYIHCDYERWKTVANKLCFTNSNSGDANTA